MELAQDVQLGDCLEVAVVRLNPKHLKLWEVAQEVERGPLRCGLPKREVSQFLEGCDQVKARHVPEIDPQLTDMSEPR